MAADPMTARVIAQYWLTGDDLDPDDVSRATGIEPTSTLRRGELPTSAARRPSLINSWDMAVERPAEIDIEPCLQELVDKLRHAWSVLEQLGRRFEAFVVISIEPATSLPALAIRPGLVQAIAELGAWIDIGISADIVGDGELRPRHEGQPAGDGGPRLA